jgi:hypothetical protein
MIKIVPILNKPENFKFEVPIALKGHLKQTHTFYNESIQDIDYVDVLFIEKMFLFTPVRHEYLMKIDGKKFTFQSITEMQKYIYNSNHNDYSFKGIIFFCGFFVEDKFECEPSLDLNKEVKYLLKSDKINCSTPSKNNKRFFTSRIRCWIQSQNLTDSMPIWCDVEGFELADLNIIFEDEIPELELVSIPENVVELEELKKVPDNNKVTFFAKIRKMLGL